MRASECVLLIMSTFHPRYDIMTGSIAPQTSTGYPPPPPSSSSSTSSSSSSWSWSGLQPSLQTSTGARVHPRGSDHSSRSSLPHIFDFMLGYIVFLGVFVLFLPSSHNHCFSDIHVSLSKTLISQLVDHFGFLPFQWDSAQHSQFLWCFSNHSSTGVSNCMVKEADLIFLGNWFLQTTGRDKTPCMLIYLSFYFTVSLFLRDRGQGGVHRRVTLHRPSCCCWSLPGKLFLNWLLRDFGYLQMLKPSFLDRTLMMIFERPREKNSPCFFLSLLLHQPGLTGKKAEDAVSGVVFVRVKRF